MRIKGIDEIVDTEVLVIGGGIAGCFAAIRASEMGASVVLLDKATIRRGGSVGPGMDHISIGVSPEGMTLEEAKKEAASMKKELVDPNVIFTIQKESYKRVLDLERFGVKVREDDGSYFIWRIPERHGYFISYRGVDTKVKLAEAVRKTKVIVVERTMGVDLLMNKGLVVGSVVVNVRDGKLTAFLSKTTILCTGDSGRQYIEPDGLFMTWHPPTNTGDGQAMAYRVGATLTNMEYVFMDYPSLRAGGGIAGIKPFEKTAILRNRNGEEILKDKKDSARRGFLMVKEIVEGRGPLYWDFRHLPEDVLKMHEREMAHEYPIIQEWFKQRGLNIRKDLIPMQLVPTSIQGGVLVDEGFRASMKGLYAAGGSTPYFRGITAAAVSGHIAGENAAQYATKIEGPVYEESKVEEITKHVLELQRKSKGTNPIHLEEAVRSITTDYVGYFKSEGLMQEGLRKLLELRKAFLNSLIAYNPHELIRCLEVRNIFDMAEMHIRASLMRRESRLRRVGILPHYRSDFPETDPNWEKLIVIRKEDGEMKLSTQEIPKLKELEERS